MAEEFVAAVEPDDADAQESAHSRDQVGQRRLHHEMKVIAHQAIGMHLKTRLLTGLGQCLEEVQPIHIILENILPPIPAAPTWQIATGNSTRSLRGVAPKVSTAPIGGRDHGLPPAIETQTTNNVRRLHVKVL
jgi:hypothetical protein